MIYWRKQFITKIITFITIFVFFYTQDIFIIANQLRENTGKNQDIPKLKQHILNLSRPTVRDKILYPAKNRRNGVTAYDGQKILCKVLSDLGRDVNIEEVIQNSRSGLGHCSFAHIKQAAKSYGMKAQGIRTTLGGLKNIIQDKKAIVFLTPNKLFTQILDIDEDSVQVYIPGLANPEYRMPKKIFQRYWNGNALIIGEGSSGSIAEASELYADELVDIDLGGYGNCQNVDISGGEKAPVPGITLELDQRDMRNKIGSVIIPNGDLILEKDDIFIKGIGEPLQLRRYYQSEVFSTVEGFTPLGGSGSWSVQDGVYHGQGHITVTDRTWNNPTIELDVKTRKQGESSIEVAAVDFCFTDVNNRYVFFIARDPNYIEEWEDEPRAYFFLGEWRDGNLTWIVEGASDEYAYHEYDGSMYTIAPSPPIKPLEWNHIKIEYKEPHVKIWVNGIWYIKTRVDHNYIYGDKIYNPSSGNPPPPDYIPVLSQGKVGLEAHLCAADFDNVHIQDNEYILDCDFSEDDNNFVFGYGWTFTYGLKIREADTGSSEYAVVYREDGRKDWYKKHETAQTSGLWWVDTGAVVATYDTPKGIYDTLVKTANGYILRTKYGTKYNFSIGGRLENIVDRNGNQTTLSYSSDKLSTVNDSSGRQLVFEYGSNGYVSKVTYPGNKSIKYFYGDTGNLIRVDDAKNNPLYYKYYLDSHNLGEYIDRESHSYKFGYFYNNQVSYIENPLGNRLYFDYLWDTIVITNEKGQSYSYNYDQINTSSPDASGDKRIPLIASETDYSGMMKYYTWDDNAFNLIGFKDRNSNSLLFTYDQWGNPKSIKDPQNYTHSFSYEDHFNKPTVFTDANSKTYNFSYSTNNGDLLTITGPQPTLYTNNMTYYPNGLLKTSADVKNNIAQYFYNAYGYPEQIIDAEGHVAYFTYDELGNRLTMKDANGYITTYQYDENGNLTAIISPEPFNYTITFTYDKENHITSVTNANGYTTVYKYDALYNVPSIEQYLDNGVVYTTSYEYDTTNAIHFNGRNLTRQIDANGRVAEYEYDENDRLVKIIQKSENGDIEHGFVYDNEYNIKGEIDPNGNIITHDYTGWNRLVKTTYPDGSYEGYDYDPNGNLKSQTDKNGRMIIYDYDELNRLIQQKQWYGSQWIYIKYSYDGNGNLTEFIDPEGKKTVFVYDKINQLSDIKKYLSGQEKVVRHMAYDNVGNLKTITNAENKTVTYQYNQLNRLTDIIQSLSGQQVKYTFDYDKVGNRTKAIDPMGKTTFYQYDGLNQLTDIIRYLGSAPIIQHVDYDKVGNITRVIYPEGNTVRYEYDEADRLVRRIKELDGQDLVKQFEYNPAGNLISSTDEEGNVATYIYNNLNRLTDVTDAEGNTTSFTYYPGGEIKEAIDAKGNTTVYTYNELGKVATITYYDNTYETFGYNKAGMLITRKKRDGQVIQYTYDDWYRLKTQVYPNSSNITYNYNLADYLTSVTDSNGTIQYSYDDLYRTTQVANPGNTVAYQYDKAGFRTRLTYPNGNYITYTPDDLYRLTSIDFNGGTQVAEYTYNKNGSRLKTVYPNGIEAVYAYDTLGRITDLFNRKAQDPSQIISKYTYDYDNVGNKIQETSHKGISTYLYDRIYRLIEATVSSGKLFQYLDYDGVGNCLKRVVDGLTTDYSYNQMHQVTQSINNNNQVGNKITVRGKYTEENIDKITVNNTQTTVNTVDSTFTAENISLNTGTNTLKAVATDKIGRTSQHEIQVKLNKIKQAIFSYDKNGNMSTKTIDGSTTTCTYDYENRLIQIQKPAGEGSIGWQETFNPKKPGWRDNTTDPGWNCVIDNTGRVTVVSSTPVDWGHVYSPLIELSVDQYPILTVEVSSLDSGQYVNFSLEIQDYYGSAKTWLSQSTQPGKYSVNLKELMNWTGTHKFYVAIWIGGGAGKGINLSKITIATNGLIKYTYDPFGRRVQKYVDGTITKYIYDGDNLIEERTGSNTLIAQYIYGSNIDRPVAVIRNSQTYYYHYDGHGNITGITDSTGILIEEYEYDPFGKPKIIDPATKKIRTASVISNPFLFTGREFDTESGLYYYRARYYDTEIGRFIQADPIGYRGGMNLYAYCFNNPINYIDPYGYSWLSDLWDDITDWFEDVWEDVEEFFEDAFDSIKDWISEHPFLGSLIGGVVGGIVGALISKFIAVPALAYIFSGAGNSLIGPLGTAIITGIEFAIPSFTGALGAGLGGGADFRDALKSALISGAIGAGIGFGIGYSYAAGWQSFIHGFNPYEYKELRELEKLYKELEELGKQVELGPWGTAKEIIYEHTPEFLRPTPDRVVRWGGSVLKASGYTVAGRTLGIAGNVLAADGTWTLFGRVAGSTILGGVFSFLGPGGTVIGGIVGGAFGGWIFGGLDPSGAGYLNYDLDELYYDQYGYEWWK